MIGREASPRRGRLLGCTPIAMGPFDFVLGFYSVVLGVAVAQLMTNVGRLIEERDRVRGYWVSHVWILTVLLGDVGNWWSMWGVREVKRWSVYSFLLLVALLATVYLMTVLLFPRIPDGGAAIDLERHYFRSRRVFFSATAASWLLALACNWTFFPITLFDPWNVVPAVMGGLSVVAAFSGNRIFHMVFAILGLVAMVLVLVTQGVWIG
jgi:hypothetical protein